MKINPLFIIIGVSVAAAGIGVALFMVMGENTEQQRLLEEQEKTNIQQQYELEIKQIELEEQELAKQQQELELESKELEQRQQQMQIEKQQSEIRQQEMLSQQQQAEIERKQQEIYEQELIKQQQQEEYEKRIEAEKQSTLQILASNNPLLKQIMTGEVTFWAEPIPYYAAPGVADSVDKILDTFDDWNGVRRVYNQGSADIQIEWIKEFSPSQGGQYWQSIVQVGLGQTNCKGQSQPFASHSVRQILWHEIGHAMGYGHSKDQNNIMWGEGLQKYFYKEYEDDLFLEDGHFKWILFCNGGQYTFKLKSSSESNGFKFWVITSETDAKKFITENEGSHFPKCTEKGLWVSHTKTCNVGVGSYLLIYNPRDNDKAINVDVVTQYTGGKHAYDMKWDPDALRESSQYQYYLDSLR